MKSIKRGRGPSFMGGIMSIFFAFFGVIWTILASESGGVFSLFGILFIIIAIINAVYNFKNATGKNRYSEFDITENDEENDPLNERFGDSNYNKSSNKNKFCPYCGSQVEEDFEYCNVCGKKLP